MNPRFCPSIILLYIVASVAEIFRAPGSRRHTSQAQK
jgi:hypothetical protein